METSDSLLRRSCSSSTRAATSFTVPSIVICTGFTPSRMICNSFIHVFFIAYRLSLCYSGRKNRKRRYHVNHKLRNVLDSGRWLCIVGLQLHTEPDCQSQTALYFGQANLQRGQIHGYAGRVYEQIPAWNLRHAGYDQRCFLWGAVNNAVHICPPGVK